MRIPRFTQLLSLLSLVFIFPTQAEASHLMGASINYECMNNCTIRVHLRAYRDCTGASGIGNTINYTTTSGSCSTPSPINAWSPQQTTEVTPICPSWTTYCTGPNATLNGVQEYYWYREYNICGGASGCTFDVTWTTCCRNPAITGLANPGSQSMFVTSTLNTTLTGCNSSPIWNQNPVVYICDNQPHFSDQGATDADGDSLVYRQGPCYNTTGSSAVTYNTGYGPLAPLGPNWTTYLDPQTGQFTILPSPGATVVGVLCIHVDEYRNGVLIGTYQRDIQVTTIPCPPGNSNPVLSGITNLSGPSVSQNGDTLFMCAQNSVSFDMSASDPNMDTVTLFWSQNVAGASFTETGNPLVTDTIIDLNPSGTFSWTPVIPGTYEVVFFAGDTYCPFPSYDLDTVIIVVGSSCSAASASLLGCNDVEFEAQGYGGVAPYTYAWSGQGGLSSSADSLVHTYPGPGTYTWQVIITDAFSLNDTISGVVTVAGPVFTPMIASSGNIDPCGSGSALLAVGSGYSAYLWNTAATTPTITVTSPGTYSVTVTDNNGCQFYDSIQVTLDLPDVSGYISTSTSAPLANQRVYLVKYDFNNASLIAIDTTYTDAGGYYQFCTISDTVVFVKAAPDSLTYPTEMPTYADTALVWNHARPLSLFSVPHQLDFSTQFGQNPGGSGFLGGLISLGANKTSGVGDPVPGLTIFLVDDATETVVGYTVTDNNGYFSFGNLPYANFRVIPDAPGVDDINVPVVNLSSTMPSRDSLDFRLHSTYLELVLGTESQPQVQAGFAFSAAPNPYRGSTRLNLVLDDRQNVKIEVYTINGQKVATLADGEMHAGKHEFTFSAADAGFAPGIYFVKLKAGDRLRLLKVVETQ